ncbi:uncharacterized protein LOC135480259 [Liolophura sinensis]|uniref:uncharacterized protein LOC135480259 n=1 Tax=Liolophura sinensis TaxID=3198878 RepID=UPI0031587A3D
MTPFCFAAAAAAAPATSSSIPDVSVSAGTSDAGYDEISQDYYLYDNYARPESVTSVSRDQGRSPSPYKTKGDNQRQHGKAEDRRPKHVSKVTVRPKEVVTSQSQVVTSHHKTVAKGPNSELCEGADLSRVERYGVVTNGPNRNLRKGPDPSRVKGSQGAKGHDPSLCRGPQPELHQGPQPNLCRGPATIITASRTLISQV